MTDRTCEGCGKGGATEFLRFEHPLGETGVHVHKDEACALMARQKRGGGRWLPRDDLDRALDPREPLTLREYITKQAAG